MVAWLAALIRTPAALVAGALIVCLPSGALHVNLCDCNGLLVETHADPCPCEEPAPPTPCASSCCGKENPLSDAGDEPAEPGDSCCDDLSLDYLHGTRDGAAKAPGADDVEPDPGFDAVAALPAAATTQPRLVRATGPPSGPPAIRRLLVELASVVLLI